MTAWSGPRRWLLAAVALALLVTPAATALPSQLGPPDGVHPAAAHIDPALLEQVASRPAPALLTWDEQAASRAEVAAYLEDRGIAHHVFSMLSIAVGCAADAKDVLALSRAPGAVSVWGDEPLTPTLATSVPTAFNGDPEAVWSGLGVTGKGVGIAVLDTGIDGTHPDLEYGRRTLLNARVIISHYEILGAGQDTCFPDAYQEDLEDSETVSGHGTHLASVAAGDGTASGGTLRGMAPEADLVGLNIVEQTTPEVDGDVQLSLIRFIAAVNYVLVNALDGGPTVTKVALLGWTSPGLFDPWHPHSWAVRDLFDFGIAVVLPTGNEGPAQSRCDDPETCHFNRLAVGPAAIAVGATPKDSRTDLEDYSSRGDPSARQARNQLVRYEPTLVAPGSHVVAARRPGLVTFAPPLPTRYPLAGGGEGLGDDPTNLDYQSVTGTSVAAAHVAGTIALMQQAAMDAKGCFLPSWQVKEILAETATPMPGYQVWEVGAGAVDATAAVAAAREAPKIPSADPWVCPRR